MNKVAIVTGSSSGIGLETALTLARNGFDVYATMRNTGKAGQLQEAAKGLPLRVCSWTLTTTRRSKVQSTW